MFAEKTAFCCTLPSSDCDCRRDNECIRSRRQVLKIYLSYFLFPSFFHLFVLLLHFQPPFISCDLYPLSLTKSCLDYSNKRHSSPLCLQSCRCFDGGDSPAARHRHLCSDGAPGCMAVPGITPPHRPLAHLRLCGSQQSSESELAQTKLQVDRLKIFSVLEQCKRNLVYCTLKE